MLELLREGDSEPATLDRGTRSASAGCSTAARSSPGTCVRRRAAIEQLQGMLAGASEIEWTALKRAASPKLVTSGETPEFKLEGVTVWRESQEPWRPVKRLIVLGFAQGHYPAALATNPVFSRRGSRGYSRGDGAAGDAAAGGTRAAAGAVPTAARGSHRGGDVPRAAAGLRRQGAGACPRAWCSCTSCSRARRRPKGSCSSSMRPRNASACGTSPLAPAARREPPRVIEVRGSRVRAGSARAAGR